MEHIDHISPVHPGRKKFTRGGEQEHCFSIVKDGGRRVDIMRYESEELAQRERAALIAAIDGSGADEEAIERTIDELMETHLAAKITPQEDGSRIVVADGKYEYVVFADGTRTGARELF